MFVLLWHVLERRRRDRGLREGVGVRRGAGSWLAPLDVQVVLPPKTVGRFEQQSHTVSDVVQPAEQTALCAL
jgi:hypothetical protein